jgi:excisionase family DNA binding protein
MSLLSVIRNEKTIPHGEENNQAAWGIVLWYKDAMPTLTTLEAADRLGVTARRVRALIQAEQLPAEKKGRDYLIDEKDLKLVKNRKAGRPSTKKIKSQK